MRRFYWKGNLFEFPDDGGGCIRPPGRRLFYFDGLFLIRRQSKDLCSDPYVLHNGRPDPNWSNLFDPVWDRYLDMR